MGLPDRLKAYQQEQAAKQAAEAESARRAQKENINAHKQWETNDRKKRERILTELSPLLQAIDAKGQLEDLRRIWGGIGKIESDASDGTRPLALVKYSYEYWDLGSYTEHILDPGEGRTSDPVYYFVAKNQRGYEIAVQNIPEPAFRITWHADCFSGNNPNKWLAFNPSHIKDSKKILEDTLFEYLNQTPHPAQVKSEAKRRVFKSGLTRPWGVYFQ